MGAPVEATYDNRPDFLPVPLNAEHALLNNPESPEGVRGILEQLLRSSVAHTTRVERKDGRIQIYCHRVTRGFWDGKEWCPRWCCG